jgi:hypothetical protein
MPVSILLVYSALEVGLKVVKKHFDNWKIQLEDTGRYSSKPPEVERFPIIPLPCNCLDAILKGFNLQDLLERSNNMSFLMRKSLVKNSWPVYLP